MLHCFMSFGRNASHRLSSFHAWGTTVTFPLSAISLRESPSLTHVPTICSYALQLDKPKRCGDGSSNKLSASGLFGSILQIARSCACVAIRKILVKYHPVLKIPLTLQAACMRWYISAALYCVDPVHSFAILALVFLMEACAAWVGLLKQDYKLWCVMFGKKLVRLI